MIRRALAHFDLDGSASRTDWWRAVVSFVPPLVVAGAAAWLDGVDGTSGWLLWVGFYVAATCAWLLLLARFHRPPD